MPLTRSVTTALPLALALLGLSTAGAADSIDQQRELFVQTYAAAERGNWQPVATLSADERAALERYPLWPDLRGAYLRATIRTADTDEIDAFLDRYGTLKPGRDLRYRYARQLARSGDLAGYFEIYQQYYQGLEIPALDCLGLQAEIADGRDRRIVNRGKALWLVGVSQADECDPVFDFLKSEQHLTRADYEQRFALAIAARQFSLARWLGRSIGPEHVATAEQWLSASANPEQFARQHQQWTDSATTRDQLVYAIERLTYRDPDIAHRLWQELNQTHRFTAEQELTTARHIALWTARDRLPDAYDRLTRLSPAAQNEEVARWRARTSLRLQRWEHLLADIDQMSPTEQQTEEWRYWRGIAQQRTEQTAAAATALAELAAERSYYGFLAADELQLEYAMEHREIAADNTILQQLVARPDLIRARELFKVGLDSRGRSEWDQVVRQLSAAEKVQAAKLADEWGWHSRAIATLASAGEYDNLALRYPLPYMTSFEEHAASASIPSQWAYGIARSESLFMRDVRSSAGAIGLMQLMPATGKEVAASISLPYAGVDTLTNPQSNIRLGTSYLGQMAARYGGNRVLATAAYNAGPHRVDRWLPATGKQDARIWIENIPFNETRKYVRRVMAAETIFHWRMTGEVRRLSSELGQIDSASLVAAL